jgi:inositol 1,4,5-triphosphate receptor type 1
MAYDMAFFFLMIVINMNLILGIIIDTFADLRKDKQDKDDLLKLSCFVCGLPRQVFDSKGLSNFEKHVQEEHCLWSYLHFVVLLRTKDPTEFTGQESFVHRLLQRDPPDLGWFPRLTAMSLSDDAPDNDRQQLQVLLEQLARAVEGTEDLSARLLQLQQNMAVQRKEATREGMQARGRRTDLAQ